MLPDVPTVAEQGYPDYDVAAWVALVAPKGTPARGGPEAQPGRARRAEAEDVVEQLATLGAEPAGGTPEALAAFMLTDAQKWAEVVKKA